MAVNITRNRNNRNSNKRNNNRFKTFMQKKLVILFICVLLAFIGLGIKLLMITQEDGEQYKRKVLSQQRYTSTILPYRRGDILDRNGSKLATSEKVYNLVLDCEVILSKESYLAATLEALRNNFEDINSAEITSYIQEHPKIRYYVIKKKLTYNQIAPYLELIANPEQSKDVVGIWFEEEYKRVYPNNSLACDVIGFTGKDSRGNYGLEEYYSNTLNGTNGREYGYLSQESILERNTISPIDGNNIITTIDANIQGIVEKYLKAFNEEHRDNYREGNGSRSSACIVMDVNSGEVLAMADYPAYNLNDTTDANSMIGSELLDENGKRLPEPIIINAENVGELENNIDVKYQNLNLLWKNFCITDTYEPGSTAKPFTVAAGLESGRLSGNEHYTCNGVLHVGDHDIACNNIYGHGTLSVRQALEQSCNVCLMHMADRLGKNNMLKFQDIFNFGYKTNIDLSGEARTDAVVYNEKTMRSTELATASFGQGYNVSMIQMITGFSALVNGGYYYQPRMVKQIVSSSGTIIENIDSRLIKQVISNETSQAIVNYCNGAVANGTGRSARPAGYAIGGKTGTAEKVPRDKKNYVVSFIGFAPADDPKIAIYVVIDEPNVAFQPDAKYATRVARSILTEVLPYMNIFMTEELSEAEEQELAELNIARINEARLSISGNNLTEESDVESDKIDGDGDSAPGDGTTQGEVLNQGDNAEEVPVSIILEREQYDTAPLTGTLLNPITGESSQEGRDNR